MSPEVRVAITVERVQIRTQYRLGELLPADGRVGLPLPSHLALFGSFVAGQGADFTRRCGGRGQNQGTARTPDRGELGQAGWLFTAVLIGDGRLRGKIRCPRSRHRRVGIFLVSPILLFEPYAAELRLCHSRRNLRRPPYAMCPWAPGFGVRAVRRPWVNRPRTATDQPTDRGGKGHGRGRWERLYRPPAWLLASDLAFQDA